MASDPKTVRVRIAVFVEPGGRWYATGWSEQSDDYHDGCRLVDPNRAHYWIEADLPAPEVKTVQGEVREVGE